MRMLRKYWYGIYKIQGNMLEAQYLYYDELSTEEIEKMLKGFPNCYCRVSEAYILDGGFN